VLWRRERRRSQNQRRVVLVAVLHGVR
jgi:hypothetical protein